MKKFSVFILYFIYINTFTIAQPGSDSTVAYTPDFKFREGIYLNFDQVKNNRPLSKSRVITNLDYDDPDFFNKVLKKDKIYYYNSLGGREELKTSKIWGYSRNGFVYINMRDGFFRITLIGSICHFVASHTTYSSAYNSPYGYGMYADPYRMYPTTISNTEMRQYILDFEHGRVMDYTPESVSVCLMNDPELHDEYISLRKKKRRQLKFMYIRKYNEKHTLYFPAD